MTPVAERRQSSAHQEAPLPEPSESQQEETTESSDVLDVRKYEAHFIQRRKSDGFVNATSMATACGKFLVIMQRHTTGQGLRPGVI